MPILFEHFSITFDYVVVFLENPPSARRFTSTITVTIIHLKLFAVTIALLISIAISTFLLKFCVVVIKFLIFVAISVLVFLVAIMSAIVDAARGG
jgi:hypothetical protein